MKDTSKTGVSFRRLPHSGSIQQRICAGLVVGLLLFGSGSSRGSDPFFGASDFRHNHRETRDPARRLVVAKDGIVSLEIVVPSPVEPVVRFAAQELKQFLDRSLKADIPIVRTRTGNAPAIFLGNNAWTRSWGIDVSALPRDAFIIKSNGFGVPPGCILIAGRDDPFVDPEATLRSGLWAQLYERGTLFGVYEFLARFVGVRFCFPGEAGTVIPVHRSLDIPAVDIFEAPDFMLRNVSSWYGGEHDDATADVAEIRRLRNLHYIRLRAQTAYIPNNHGLARLAYLERFGSTHPTFFSLLPGGRRDVDPNLQHAGALCYSNPDLRNEIFEDAKAFLSGISAEARGVRHARWNHRALWDASGFQPGFFNVMPQDGLGENRWCRCDACWPYWTEGRPEELVWGYTVELAERLRNEGVPGYLTQMAYGPFKQPPSFEIPDNVLVQLAVYGPWNEDNAQVQGHDDDLVHAWNAKLSPRKVWLWNYMTNHGDAVHPGVPPVSTRALHAYYQRLAPHLLGAYLQTELEWDLFRQLNHYVFYKTAWDASVDVEQMLEDHHLSLFGDAAAAMNLFFNRLEEVWMTRAKPESTFTELGPRAVRRNEREIWDEIYTAELMNELAGYYDRAEAAVAEDAASLKRVHFFRRHYLGHMIEKREAYTDLVGEVEDLVLEIVVHPGDAGIVVDGEIEEPAWAKAEAVYLVPVGSEDRPLVSTVVRTLGSDTHLYVSFDCSEPHVDALLLADREADDPRLWQDASVEVMLDPSGDRTSYYQIIVSAAGVVADQKTTWVDGVRTLDWGWQSHVKAATRIGTDGYRVELAIPLSALGVESLREGSKWVGNFNRSRHIRTTDPTANQYYSWSPYLRRGFGEVDRFGQLTVVEERRQDADNLIRNSDFGSQDASGRLSAWHLSRPEPEAVGHAGVTDKDFRSAGRSLHLQLDGASRVMAMQGLPELQPDTEYLLTFFVRAEDVGLAAGSQERQFGGYVNIWAGRNFFFPKNAYRDTFGWSKAGIRFRTPEDLGSRTPYIRLVLMNASGSVWFDEVRLRPADTARAADAE